MEYTHRKMITRLKSHYKSIVVWAQLLLLEASFSKYRTEKEDEIGLAIQRPSPLASTARGDRAERTNKQPNLMRCIGKKGCFSTEYSSFVASLILLLLGSLQRKLLAKSVTLTANSTRKESRPATKKGHTFPHSSCTSTTKRRSIAALAQQPLVRLKAVAQASAACWLLCAIDALLLYA